MLDRRWGLTLAVSLVVLGAMAAGPLPAQAGELIPTFKRGDLNGDERVNLLDTFILLDYFFLEEAPPFPCDDAFDLNDDGNLGLPDVFRLLNYQFLNGVTPANPFTECGRDPTDDDELTCEEYTGCDPIEPGLTPEELELYTKVAHMLRRMAFGHHPDTFDRILDMEDPVADYITEQLDPASIDEPDILTDLLDEISPEDNLTDLYRLQIIQAIYSERQLNEVLTDFWEDHFNTNFFVVRNYFRNLRIGATPVYTLTEANELAARHEHDENVGFRESALGLFEDLLVDSATNVTMLIYLDAIRNIVDFPNENYPREILELHTFGVDNGYNQADIVEVALIFTGWGICLVDEADADDPHADCIELTLDPPDDAVWAFHFFPENHDWGSKSVFSAAGGPRTYSVPAGDDTDAEAGLAEGLDFIGYLVEQNETWDYISTKLVQRLVNDDAPGGLVAAAIFTFDDAPGDIRDVVETILTDDAPGGAVRFFDEDHTLAKVRTPFEFLVATVRTFDGEADSSVAEIITALARMGNLPFTFGTPDGYPESAVDQLGTAPFLERWNFCKLIYEDDDGLEFPNLRTILSDHDVTLSDAEEIARFWLDRLFPGQYDPTDKDLLIEYLTTNAEGEEQVLSPAANLYNQRLEEAKAFIGAFPQSVKQ